MPHFHRKEYQPFPALNLISIGTWYPGTGCVTFERKRNDSEKPLLKQSWGTRKALSAAEGYARASSGGRRRPLLRRENERGELVGEVLRPRHVHGATRPEKQSDVAGSRFSNPMRCGLGITFREDFGGKLHVHGLLPDGAGDRCGAVQVREPDGKRLGAVDGINVEGMRQEHISSLCLGLEGTEVRRAPALSDDTVTTFNVLICLCRPGRCDFPKAAADDGVQGHAGEV
eukprot:3248222-Rhodomonas_salina.7